MILIGILSWNNLKDIKILLESVFYEINDEFEILVVDNGSTDGTIDYLSSLPINLVKLKKNYGIGVAKNLIISHALSLKLTYMFMFDTDVKIISNSLKSMINFMDNNKNVGCFGQHIDFYTKKLDDNLIAKTMPELYDVEYNIKSGCGAIRAWTHYAIYRVSVFDQGVKFDTDGPFGQAGYGFDDDDLGMQIYKLGYDIACFKGVYCYHNVNSSVPILKLNNSFNNHEREKYFLKKWETYL